MREHGSERPLVLLLVGPKGCGKTTIGRMMARRAGTHFLEVEAVAKRVLAAMGGVIDESYARRAFEAILAAIRDIEPEHEVVVLETTGASDETPWLIEQLRERYALRLVRIRAGAETCADRIASRDPSRQIDVSQDMVRAMHARTEALELPWDLTLDNETPVTQPDVERALAELV